MSYDPKDNFVKFHEKAAAELRSVVKQPWFLTAVSFAMSEMASRNITSEQMAGAVIFVQTLDGLGDAKVPFTKLPEKRLMIDNPVVVEPPKKKGEK